MKREAANCSKMKKLCRVLGVPTYAAVGILESLWHLTAREAPRGDIGRLSDDDIALSIDWEDDAGELVAALIEAKWLDVSVEHRLIVHDWQEHSDDAVDMKLARAGKRYANGEMPRMNKISKGERARLCAQFGWEAPENSTADSANVELCSDGAQKGTERHDKALPEPEPEPVPVPAQVQVLPQPPQAGADEENFESYREAFWPETPRHATRAAPELAPAVDAVMAACSFGNPRMRPVVEAQVRLEVDRGDPPGAAATRMVAAWKEFQHITPLLRIVWGPRKFFGEGHWRKPELWPVDAAALRRQSEAMVGRMG